MLSFIIIILSCSVPAPLVQLAGETVTEQRYKICFSLLPSPSEELRQQRQKKARQDMNFKKIDERGLLSIFFIVIVLYLCPGVKEPILVVTLISVLFVTDNEDQRKTQLKNPNESESIFVDNVRYSVHSFYLLLDIRCDCVGLLLSRS